MSRITISRKSNWETIAFLLIDLVVSSNQRVFYRQKLFNKQEFDDYVRWLGLLGHNANSPTPEKTLDATIQKLRNKGFVDFLEPGEYRLTDKGYEEMLKTKESWNQTISELKEELKLSP